MADSIHSPTGFSIQTKGLSVGYFSEPEPAVLLKDIDLMVKPGSLIALTGKNGSGKSTLIKTLLRLHKPLSGVISLFNRNINSYSLNEYAKFTSYVSTENLFVQNLNIYNLVALGRFPYTNWIGRLTSEDRVIINRSLQQVGIEHKKNNNINEISDGERQRALIARTLAQNTPVIFLDEPTSYLDLPNKYEIIHLLQQLAHKHSKTIIFSTHDIQIALLEADLFWIIHEENIIEGTPEDLILNKQIEKLFTTTNLQFNNENGEFGIIRAHKAFVNLYGEGSPYFWTSKALLRIGIRVDNSEKQKMAITIKTSHDKTIWEIVMNQIKSEVSDIRALIEFLHKKNA